MIASLCAALAGLLLASPAVPETEGPNAASTPTHQVPTPRRGYRPALDGTATAVAGAFFLFSSGARVLVSPPSCRWCEPGRVDLAVRSRLRWRDTEDAAVLSDVTALWWAPGLAFGLHTVGLHRIGGLRGSGEDYLVVLESFAITAGLTNAFKIGTARQRPYAHFSPEPIPFEDDPDQNLGFVSGHTSIPFSIAVSTATVATLRRHRLAPWIWGTAVPLAAFSGYLRIAADRHYLVDVLAGAGLGAAVGVAVPLLVHSAGPRWRRTRANVRILPTDRGIVVTGRF